MYTSCGSFDRNILLNMIIIEISGKNKLQIKQVTHLPQKYNS